MKKNLLTLLILICFSNLNFAQTTFVTPIQNIDGPPEFLTLDAGSLVGGSGYIDAVNIPVTGGTGVGATVDITTAGGVVTSVNTNNPGFYYEVGQTLTITGGNGDATIDILVVDEDFIGEEPYELASGDLDGDGDIDLVFATYWYTGFGTPTQDYIKWYENDGSGNFSTPTSSVISSTIFYVDGLTVADIDGKFGDDIIATSADQNKLVYFLSDGAGGFGSEVVVSNDIAGAGQVFAGDINNDGNIDLATVSYDDNKSVWFAGDGLGGFGMEQIIESGSIPGTGAFTIELGDFDGDTDLDAVIGFYNSGNIEIYYNQYIESMTNTVSWEIDDVTVSTGNVYFLATKFADVNNDGKMDVVKVDNGTGNVKWYNKVKDGASTENPISDATIIADPGAIAIADIDNDTFNDVILTDSGTADDAIIWFKGADEAGPSSTPTLIENNNYQNFAITVDDYDSDGDLDIAFLGNQNDTLGWYENELINLGINDNSLETINIFPNPTKDKLNFKSSLSERLDIVVYDILGKKIINKSVDVGNSLDVSKLHSGLYIIKFEGYSDTYKFVKE